MTTITLPDGSSARQIGSRMSQLERRALPGWPHVSAEGCAQALNGSLQQLLALDDVLHWLEIGGTVVLLANAGLLFDAAADVGTGEADCLVDVPGAAADKDSILKGCFACAADGAPSSFVGTAALERGWMALGGWSIVRPPPGFAA